MTTFTTTLRPPKRGERVNLVESYTRMQAQAEVIWNQSRLKGDSRAQRDYIAQEVRAWLMENLTAQLHEIEERRAQRLFEELGKCTTEEAAINVLGSFLVAPEIRVEADPPKAKENPKK